MVIADTLSRAYLPQAKPNEFSEEIASLTGVNQLDELSLVASQSTIDVLLTAAADDEQYKQLKDQIAVGWPDSAENLPPALKPLYTFVDELSTSGGLVFKGPCVVVPVGA